MLDPEATILSQKCMPLFPQIFFLCLHSWNLENFPELLSRNHFKLENDNALLMRIMSKAGWKKKKQKKALGWKSDSLSSHPWSATNIWELCESLNPSQSPFLCVKWLGWTRFSLRSLPAIKFYILKINVLPIKVGVLKAIFYQWISNLMFTNTVVWFSWPSLYHS